MATEEQLLEIHRLAVLGGEPSIAQDISDKLAGHWLRVSRFRDVRVLVSPDLDAGPAR